MSSSTQATIKTSDTQSRSVLFSLVSDKVGANLRFNCPGFKLSKFIKPVSVNTIIGNTFFVICGTNTTCLGNVKGTILILNLARDVVATYSTDLRYAGSFASFESNSIACFTSQFYETTTVNDVTSYVTNECIKAKIISKSKSSTPEALSAVKPSFIKRLFNVGK